MEKTDPMPIQKYYNDYLKKLNYVLDLERNKERFVHYKGQIYQLRASLHFKNKSVIYLFHGEFFLFTVLSGLNTF